jgi:formamidopyrimidine-DNA glycosylase
MDQKKIAGIGNIYANEALFCAGIAPVCKGKDLLEKHPEKITKLYQCIKKVLRLGLKYKGATVEDDAYRNSEGKRGEMQYHLKVYRKEGQPCPRHCGGIIQRITLGGRGTFFCPQCQKA